MGLLLKNIIFQEKERDIFIRKGKIEKIGKNLNVRAKEKIDCQGRKAVLPGLINCHTHSAMVLFRGYADDLPLKKWLEEKIWPLEARLSREDVYWGTKLACLEMLKSGTTAFNEMYFFPEAQAEAVREMGLRAKIGLPLIDFLPEYRPKSIEKLYQRLKRVLDGNRLSIALAPHSIYTVSRENLIWAKDFAKKHNLPLHLHLSETEQEVEECLLKYKKRPVEFLEEIGFLGNNCLLAHSIWLSDKEIALLSKRKPHLIYNPCSNLKLGSGIFSYLKLKREGLNICLGTDSAVSNNSLDLIREIKVGSLLQKGAERSQKVLPAKEALEILTKNGARALRTGAGEIREGGPADLIFVDLEKIYFQPPINFLSSFVYSASGECVSDVICGGKIIMRERRIEGEKEIIRKSKERARGLLRNVHLNNKA